jgi:hypothetical protein
MARQTYLKKMKKRAAPATLPSITVRASPIAPAPEEPSPGCGTAIAGPVRGAHTRASVPRHHDVPVPSAALPEPDPAAGQTQTQTQTQGLTHAYEAELADNMLQIHGTIYTSRPKGTHLAYSPKQLEFQAHCQARGYADKDTVTEQKLLFFLSNEVVNRPLRRRSRKAGPDVPLEDTQLSWRSVRSYLTAITDLWQQQRALGMNNHPSPRESLARSYIRSLQRTEAERNRATFADKGQDTLLDGYSEPELLLITQKLWSQTSERPARTEYLLRTITDLLLSHYMLARGDHRRAAEISDLFTFEFPGEGPTRCMPLIFTTRAGKTNQHGRLETAGALRSRDPAICLLGAVGFYLLFRWDLSPEPFPDFGSSQHWYNIRLLKAGTDPTSGLSYCTQWLWICRAFELAGIISEKKTHAGRSSGAKTAELKGVSESQIRRAGHWNPDQMVGCYLNSLPRKFMRSIAGHPSQMGCFNLPRAIPPPAALLSMIWPELDRWVEAAGGQLPKDLAGNGTVNLLLYLREVILQDSAFLIDQYPGSPIWSHPVFRHPEYQPFRRCVLAQASGGGREPDRLTLLSRALPEFTEHLLQSNARYTAQLAEQTATIAAEIARLKDDLQAQLINRYTTTQQQLRTMLSEAIVQIQIPEQGPPAPPGPPILDLDPALLMQVDPGLAIGTGMGPPQHTMSRAVKTVDALWQEWTTGLPGLPAISALDTQWGSRWRAGRRSEVQWYSLRLEVIREIRRVSKARRISEIEAMQAVAIDHRQSSRSLDAFCKQLRASRKLRDGGAARGRGAGAGRVVAPGRLIAPAPGGRP